MKQKYISIYRVFAMLCILACHITQSYAFDIAFMLNGAVYAFLLISGILLGSKTYDNFKNFFKERLIRILVPYYILLLVYVVLYLCLSNPLNIKLLANVFCLQWFVGGIAETGHLWYITCILLCYLIVPILQKITAVASPPKWIFWACMLVLLAGSFVLTKVTPINFMFPAIFVWGYTYTRLYRDMDDRQVDFYEISFIVVGFVSIVCRIVFEFVMKINIPASIGDLTEILFCVALLLTVKMLIKQQENGIKWKFRGGVLLFLDSISYEVYLIHHVFILGVLSVMRLTNFFVLNILLAVVLTIVFAYILHLLSNLIVRKLLKKS